MKTDNTITIIFILVYHNECVNTNNIQIFELKTKNMNNRFL
jgi:hypothetical protein